MTQTSFARQEWFGDRIARPMGAEGRYGEPAMSPMGNAADDLYTTIGDYAAFLVGVMNRTGLPARYVAQRDSLHSLDESPGSACAHERCGSAARREGVVMLTNSANGFHVIIEAGPILAGETAFRDYLEAPKR